MVISVWFIPAGGEVPPEEVGAIRERAQLLRSHALAQKTNHDHY